MLDRGFRWAFGGLTLLALAAIWTVHHLAVTDLPQHAAQVALIRRVLTAGPESALFELNWLTPYLLGHALALALTPLLSPWLAVKVVLSLAVVAFPLALLWLLRQSGGLPQWSLLGFPLAFGFGYGWGLLNYLLAAPIGLCWLAAALRHQREPTRRHAVHAALWAIATCLGHVLVFGCMLLLISAITLAAGGGWRALGKRLAAHWLPLPFFLPVLLWNRLHGVSPQPTAWALSWQRLAELPDVLLGFPVVLEPSRPPFDLLARPETLTGLFVLLAPWAVRPRLQWQRGLWLPLPLMLAAYLLAPEDAADVWILWPRLGLFIVPCLCLWLRPPLAPSRVGRWAPGLIAAAWLLVLLARAHAFDREAAGIAPVIARAEPNKRLLSLIFAQRSEVVRGMPYVNFGALYAAERDGFADFSFANLPHFVAHYRPEHVPAADHALAWDPRRFDPRLHQPYDYFLVRSRRDRGHDLLAGVQPPVQLMAHSGLWWLYGRANRHY